MVGKRRELMKDWLGGGREDEIGGCENERR